ncbi:sigma factor [Cellulomonas triticagri]|nr:sigma factor [Cellulomonas triticagri]
MTMSAAQPQGVCATDWGDALSTLVHDRGAALVRYAVEVTGSSREAEDVWQEALVRALARGLRARTAPGPDVETEVRRAIVDAHRGRRTAVAG